MTQLSDYEGLQKDIRALALPAIETWENQYQDRRYKIHLNFPEFTCICPKTGLPDFATIQVSYMPDKKCLELKSFKMYFVAYRQIGVFHEHLVNRILDDIVKASDPYKVKVEGIVNSRGGIQTTVVAKYKRVRKDQSAGKDEI